LIIFSMAEDLFLADWLNEQLKARNLSQGELARRGGVAKSVIHMPRLMQSFLPGFFPVWLL